MHDHPILGQVALGYSPVIDRQHAVVATRLTVFPEHPDASGDVEQLLAAVESVWTAASEGAAAELSLGLRPLQPGSARPAATLQPVSLNLAGERLLADVLAAPPRPQVMVEVPAFLAAEPRLAVLLQAYAEAGGTLLIKGRPLAELPQSVLAAFAFAIVDHDAEPAGHALDGLAVLRAGARTMGAVDAALQRGAVATLGWPSEEPVARGSRQGVPPDVQVVLQLIQGVDREEPVARLESVLKRDPTLGFRLLRYLNSPAFGLSVEISSFGHALMMLGYQRLKRWLALLLASSSRSVAAKPLMYEAVRRGLLMEELARGSGDPEMRGEMFICGVFSLLDQLLQQPMADLLKAVPVPERVRQALIDEAGPFQPYIDLVRAIEQESVFDIREGAEQLLLAQGEVNRAVLAALAAARALD
ncbi:EAL and HDOD domain-containing protein [Rubrivivax gelatinosus]|uniref:Histidine kinase n=1 Tax=Rubrivivax gelatinosus TaxID=28068 RepID=A0ABS1DUD1_RUBGE|nr:HDOD domain-containing protein [Rubrivivax gelatinosus]MBK1712984.1 histidine kinase [Rubrivivax gelatinosus]